MNKPAPDFRFTDLDGKPFTRDSLAGKVTLLTFWATWCQPCHRSLPLLEKVREQFKDNPKVAFRAISVDTPNVNNEKVAKTLTELGVKIPALRDSEQASLLFRTEGSVPATFLIGADGSIQDYVMGFVPDKIAEWPEKIKKLLAGEKIFEKPLKAYEDELKEYSQRVEKESEVDFSKKVSMLGDQAPVETKIPMPETKIAKRTQPATMKLIPLWKCDAVKSPGNILVLNEKNKPSRLAVVEAWQSIAEVGLDGKLIASHSLNLTDTEVIGSLRSATGSDGKRLLAAFMATHQRCHVLDENWKAVLTYPEDALKNPHNGLADVELGDLDGDGKLNLYISYLGVVGIHGVSLDGKRLWSNRSVTNAGGMVVSGPDAQGHRSLLCTNILGSLVVLDAQGERKQEIVIPGTTLHWIFAADLNNKGQFQWCGLASEKPGEHLAVGFSLSGEKLWTYRLPDGMPPPMEMIVAGRIAKDGPGQWILPASDGSIHILGADGKLIDKFNSGVTLQGVATVEINGQPTLLISSQSGVEAWKIEK